MKSTVGYCINEQESFQAMTGAMNKFSHGETYSGGNKSNFTIRNDSIVGFASMTPISSPENRIVWRNDIGMTAIHNNVGTSTSRPLHTMTLRHCSRLQGAIHPY
jgi:hypothetical protein